MSHKKISMMKLKRIIQMLNDGISQNEICRETNSSKRTVSEYKKLAQGSKLNYQQLLQKEDSELEMLLQPPVALPPPDPRRVELEKMMPEITRQLSRRYATILLVFEQYYCLECPQGYGYTQFKKYVKDYRDARSYFYHNTYLPGEE